MRLKTRLALAVAAATLWPVVALAQQQPIPPEHYTVDPRGVDLLTGQFVHGTTEVVIGRPGAGGLAYGRVFTRQGWRDTSIGSIQAAGNEMTVSAGPISEVFVTAGGGIWTSKTSNGSTVTIGASFTDITDANGNVARFDSGMGEDGDNPYGANMGLLSWVASPGGSRTDYTYNQGRRCFDWIGGHCIWGNVYRVSAVTTNRGYMLKYAYVSNDPESADWWTLQSVTGINLAVDWCDPEADGCSVFSTTWPSITYSDFASGLPAVVTDQAGRETTYTYAASAIGPLITSIRLPESTADDVAVTYMPSPSYSVSGVIDASGAWTYDYDIVGTTLTTTADGPLGQALTVTADVTVGRAATVTNGLNQQTAYQYDSDQRLTRITRPEGDYVEYEWDGRSNLTSTTWTPKPGSLLTPIEVSTTYPADCLSPTVIPATLCNKPISSTAADGGVTDYVFDATTGQPVSVTGPAAAPGEDRPQTRYAYTALQARYHDSASTFAGGGNISMPSETSACVSGDAADTPDCGSTANEVVSGLDYVTTSVPHNLDPVAAWAGSRQTPQMTRTETTWTPVGTPATVDGPLSGTADTTRYVYATNDLHQMVGVIGPDPDGAGAGLNRATRYVYNDRGLVETVETGTASGGVWANFTPLLQSHTTYDVAGYYRPLTTRLTTPAGVASSVQQVSYDAAGRVDCIAARMNPAEFASLPASACTLDTVGAFGPDRVQRLVYDALGRPVSATSGYGTADAQTRLTSYTANGLTASLTDGNGNSSIFEYDGFDRQTRLRFPNATGGGTSTTDYLGYTYDSAGRLSTTRTRAGQVTTLSYDALGRVSQMDAPSGVPDTWYRYDLLNRQVSIADSGTTPVSCSGAVICRTWDALSRLTAETTGLGAMSYQYDAAGRGTRITWPDAFYVGYDYDLYGGLTAVRENGAASGAGVLATYSWTNLGQLSSIARAGGTGVSTSYGYDDWARLSTLAHDTSGGTNDVNFTLSYNPAGQIVGRSASNAAYVYAPSVAGADYGRNSLNQITSIGGAPVGYDANQNLTTGVGPTYAYDAVGRLTMATSAPGATAYAYDLSGRLASSADAAATRRFQYSGLQNVTEYDAAGGVLHRFVPGLGLDAVVASYDGSGTSNRSWLLSDERGSVVGLAGATGSVGAINRYDEFGAPASGNTGRFQYTGQPWLEEAGAYQFRARTYMAGIGRFGQADPIQYAGGQNLYGYVGGDPINWTDPLGLSRLPADEDQFCWWTTGPLGKEPVRCRKTGVGANVSLTLGHSKPFGSGYSDQPGQDASPVRLDLLIQAVCEAVASPEGQAWTEGMMGQGVDLDVLDGFLLGQLQGTWAMFGGGSVAAGYALEFQDGRVVDQFAYFTVAAAYGVNGDLGLAFYVSNASPVGRAWTGNADWGPFSFVFGMTDEGNFYWVAGAETTAIATPFGVTSERITGTRIQC